MIYHSLFWKSCFTGVLICRYMFQTISWMSSGFWERSKSFIFLNHLGKENTPRLKKKIIKKLIKTSPVKKPTPRKLHYQGA